MKTCNLILLYCCLALTALPASAANWPAPEMLKGPFEAEALYVIDGDSIKARVRIWLNQHIETTIRIRGIDTPEIKGKCDYEKNRAQEAKSRLQELVGDKIILSDVQSDKYGNRVIADVATLDAQNVSAVMIKENLARPYFGKKRGSWCGDLAALQ